MYTHSTGFQFYSCPIPADSWGFLRIPADSGAIPEDSCRNGRGTVKYCKTVRVWDAQTGQKILHSSSVSCLSNSSISNTCVVLPVLDGNNIDVCDSDKTIPCHSSNTSLLNFCHLVGNWIMLSNNTYLIWLPNHNRSGLLWPRTTTVIGCTPTLLDFKNFVHGMNWSHCFSSLDDPI